MRYDSNVSTLDERDDIELMIVDEVHGIFTSFEMRMGLDGSLRKEEEFKASKDPKKYGALSKNH